MEIEFQDNKIIFDRVLSNLDKFVFSFVKILDAQKIKYVIVSGYVAILFGRSRATEDVDMLVEKLDFERFVKLWDELLKSFDCLNAVSASEAYHDYLKKDSAIRFAEKESFTPNMEFKFCKVELDEFSLKNALKVILNNSALFVSPIELQIAYKLYLGSEKDIEDAIHLWNVFKSKLDKTLLNKFVHELNVLDKFDLLE